MGKLSYGKRAFLMIKIRRSLRFAYSRPIPTMHNVHAGPLFVSLWWQGVAK